jgi:hypothetical protein
MTTVTTVNDVHRMWTTCLRARMVEPSTFANVPDWVELDHLQSIFYRFCETVHTLCSYVSCAYPRPPSPRLERGREI